MALFERITHDLAQAQKARETQRVSALRQLLAAIKSETLEHKCEADDPLVCKVTRKLAKQRHESIEAFRAGHRDDLVQNETAELELLQQYLPAGLSTDAVKQIVVSSIQAVGATSAKDFGNVMKHAMAAAGDQADGKQIQQLVRELLP